MMVTSDFPEKGTPKTTIVCHSAASAADQVSTKKGKNFGIPAVVNFSESGFPITDLIDLPLAALLRKICAESGIDCIVSREFKFSTYEAGKAKRWMGGESLHQFLTRMASEHDAIYQFLTKPNGKDTLVFVTRDDWFKSPVSLREDFFTYRGANSILKSVSIKADFGSDVGTFVQSVSETGQTVGVEVQQPSSPLFGEEKVQANCPLLANPVGAAQMADKLSNGGGTGRSEMIAQADTGNQKDIANSKVNGKQSNLLALEFSCLGFTRLYPGSLKFSGIGNRYSGYYNIKQVTHILDSNGYTCRGTATSFSNSEGGVSNENPDSKPIIQKEESNLFEPVGQYRDAFIGSESSTLVADTSIYGDEIEIEPTSITGRI